MYLPDDTFSSGLYAQHSEAVVNEVSSPSAFLIVTVWLSPYWQLPTVTFTGPSTATVATTFTQPC